MSKANPINISILVALTLIWGSSFILMKKGLLGLSWTELALLRIVLSGLTLLPWSLTHLKKVPKNKWQYLLAVGLFGSGIPPFLFALAQTRLDSGPTGILNTFTPISTLLIGMVLFGVRAGTIRILGLFIGLGGAAAMIILGPHTSFGGDYRYGLFVVLATLCYAFSANIIKYRLENMRALTIGSVGLGMISIPALVWLATTDFSVRVWSDPLTQTSALYIVALAVLGTAISSVMYFLLVQRTDPIFASVVTYTIPIVAVAWGLLDGERLLPIHFWGMALILAGVYLTGRGKLSRITSSHSNS